MGSRMRSREVLKIRLEVGVIARKGVHSIIHIRLCESRVDHFLRVHTWRAGHYIKEGLKREIAADVVRNGIGNFDILETTGEDLVIIVGVTPRPKALNSGVGEYRRVVEVRGIWFWVRPAFGALGLRRYLVSSPNKVERRCIRIASFCLQKSARRACAREGRNRFGGSV